jgi:hypothetical protein
MRPGSGMLVEQHPATICINLELLMMGIMVPETCLADNTFCNKTHSVSSSWPFISTLLQNVHNLVTTFTNLCGQEYR